MFNVGLSEMVLVLVVGCLVTDPKKLPGLLKTAGAYYRRFIEIKEEVWDAMRAACDNSTGTGYAVPKKRIMGDDGVLYEAYEVSDVIRCDSRDKQALDVLGTGHGSADDSAQATTKKDN
ncbi:MAG: hypothetical protein AB8U40_03665 [Anaplasma ovis]